MTAADLLALVERQLRDTRLALVRAAGLLASSEHVDHATGARLAATVRIGTDLAALADRVFNLRLAVDGRLQAEAARNGYAPKLGHVLHERARAGRDGAP